MNCKVIDHRHLSLHTHNCPEENVLQLWDLDRLSRLRTNLLDLRNRRQPPDQCTATDESPWENERHNKNVNDLVPGLGGNLQDRHVQEDPRPLLLNSFQGVNLEDLHHASADPEELDCSRAAPPGPRRC